LGTITAAAVRELLSAAARKRLECAEISSRTGLPGLFASKGLERLPLAIFTSMLEVAARETGNNAIGLELGGAFRISGLGPAGRLLQTARTLGCGLEKFTHYFASIQTNTRHALSVEDGRARLAYRVMDPTIRSRVQDANFTMAMESSIISDLLGVARKMIDVDFEHAPGQDLVTYREYFAGQLRFGRGENALTFPAYLLQVPLREADEKVNIQLEFDVAHELRQQELRSNLIQCIDAWITASLSQSARADIELAASAFGLSTRSFQRALAEYGVNYIDVRNDVRARIAKCMLSETTLPMTAIALQLGYSETSAFSRGFRLQIGQTPTAFRKRARQIAGFE
jgi:AraC-like DNA-binding protein